MEIVCIEYLDNSYIVFDGMVEYVKSILWDLKLLYRILWLCGGDLGFILVLIYDFEVFLIV